MALKTWVISVSSFSFEGTSSYKALRNSNPKISPALIAASWIHEFLESPEYFFTLYVIPPALPEQALSPRI